VLLNNEFGGPTCGKLYLYKITWSGQKASLSAAQEIALSKAYPVPRMEGLQPPPGIRLVQAGGRRNNCAFVHGGSVFGCNGAKRTPGSRPGILWYEVRIRDGALLQEGFVDDPNCDYLYPSMAVDSKGNIGIGCTRTSEKEFPSVCVMTHAAGDPAGTMRAPVVAVKGTTYFRYAGVTAMNFSNYSTTCIDPSDPNLLWTYQGYGNSTIDRQWCTAWAAFRMGAAEKAPAPELTTIPVAAGSRPQAIVSGPDGAVWFGTLTKVCRISPDREITEIPLPDNLKKPSGAPRATIVQYLVVGPDKNLWSAYNQGNAIWSMWLSGKFTVFPVPTPNVWPRTEDREDREDRGTEDRGTVYRGGQRDRPGRDGGRPPSLPQIRTCPIKASGSSGYGRAAHGGTQDAGHGSGNTFSKPLNRAQRSVPRRCRRDSHVRHRRTASDRKR